METTQPTIGATYGYARVSTAEQNANRQLDALRAAGVENDHIFVDHKSGKDFNRPGWRKLVRRMKRHDLLVITSIDRMGRNYDEILSEWRDIVKTKGVFIRVIDMPIIDTTTTHGLLAMFISDMVLQILSFVAETEREHIRTRQREGIAAAKARGVKFGRPIKTVTENFSNCVIRYKNGDYSLKTASRVCNMPMTTFWRKAQQILSAPQQ